LANDVGSEVFTIVHTALLMRLQSRLRVFSWHLSP
jgi:hypothetical protein